MCTPATKRMETIGKEILSQIRLKDALMSAIDCINENIWGINDNIGNLEKDLEEGVIALELIGTAPEPHFCRVCFKWWDCECGHPCDLSVIYTCKECQEK